MHAEDMSHHIAPIAIFHCDEQYRYDQPRQGVLQAEGCIGTVQLNQGARYPESLRELEGFERLWLIFGFHQNEGFKPLVLPPAPAQNKVGVFASRSPYRPNGLGLSCVRLEGVEHEQGRLMVSEYDLLNGSPVYDIKPYLPYADSFADAHAGWAARPAEEPWQVSFSDQALKCLAWLEGQGVLKLRAFIERELAFEPTSRRRKRIFALAEEGAWLLAYRTWRFAFRVDEGWREVLVEDVLSGWPAEKLKRADDPYGDKDIHRAFLNWKTTNAHQ